MLDENGVIRLLRSEVERAGGQSALARRENIDRTLLNKVLCGRKPPTKEIIRALKLCNAYTWHERGRQLRRSGPNRLRELKLAGSPGGRATQVRRA
jgi:hypothetical protein